MHKKLNFAPDLVPLILSGQKISTWRLWDDKDLQIGDIVDFINKKTGAYFATAKFIYIIEKPIGQLTEGDKKGHETFETDEIMYRTYTNYYKKEVTPQTPIKIIWFELINTL